MAKEVPTPALDKRRLVSVEWRPLNDSVSSANASRD